MPTPNDELVNMAETPGNITDAYYATGRYAHQELQVVLGIPDKSKIRAIHEWLTGNGELIFSEEPDKYYKVIKNILKSKKILFYATSYAIIRA